jgi:hypothetical protein
MKASDQEQVHALSQRILIKCAHRLGGAAALANHLQVSEGMLAEWLSGKNVPPVEVIMKAVGPLLGEADSLSRVAEQPQASKPQ